MRAEIARSSQSPFAGKVEAPSVVVIEFILRLLDSLFFVFELFLHLVPATFLRLFQVVFLVVGQRTSRSRRSRGLLRCHWPLDNDSRGHEVIFAPGELDRKWTARRNLCQCHGRSGSIHNGGFSRDSILYWIRVRLAPHHNGFGSGHILRKCALAGCDCSGGGLSEYLARPNAKPRSEQNRADFPHVCLHTGRYAWESGRGPIGGVFLVC